MKSGQKVRSLESSLRKQNSESRRRRLARLACLSAAATATLVSTHLASGATETWVGASFTNWDSTDWTGGNAPPQNGDTLVFAVAGTTGTSLTDDFASLAINGLTFNAGGSGFTIAPLNSSDTLSLGGNISDNAGSTEALSVPLILTAASTWTAANTTGDTLGVSGTVNNGGNLLTLNTGVGANGAINISGVISGAGGLMVNPANNAGTVTLSAAETYSGSTDIQSGTLLLNGNSATLANSTVTIGVNGLATSPVLNIVQTTAGTYNVASGIVGAGSTSTGGSNAFGMIVNTGNTTGDFVESAGTLNLNSGELRVSLNENTAGNEQLLFSSVNRSPGTHLSFDRNVQNASLNVGLDSIASQTANSQNVVFTTAPALIGNGGASGTVNLSVLPWASVNATIATYDPVNGLRALNTSTEMAALTSGMSLGSGSEGENAKISGNTSISANTTINSLYGTGGTITFGTSSTSLSVSSGAIMANVGFVIGSTANNGILAFGSSEGCVEVSNTRSLTINSEITGTGGLTVTLDDLNGSTSNLVLAGSNTYTGTTTFEGNENAMTVRLTNGLALQDSTLNYNNYGASFTFGNGGTTGLTAYTFGGLEGAQNITLANNNTTVQAMTLTVGGDGDSTTYSGNLLNGSAAGGAFVLDGTGTMTLLGTGNTYTGGTSVENGTLILGHGGVLATSNFLNLGSGTTSGVFQLGDATAAVNTTVTSITTSGSGTANAIIGGNASVSTLTLAASGTDVYSGAIGGSGANNNNLGLNVTSGNLTLSGKSPLPAA